MSEQPRLLQITSGSINFLYLDDGTVHRDSSSIIWIIGTTHVGEDDRTIQRDTNASGLSEEDIEKCLKTRNSCGGDRLNNKGEEEEECETCAICLDDMCRGKEKDETVATIGILDCGHEYHVCCIKRWLRSKNFCPLCKAVACESVNN